MPPVIRLSGIPVTREYRDRNFPSTPVPGEIRLVLVIPNTEGWFNLANELDHRFGLGLGGFHLTRVLPGSQLSDLPPHIGKISVEIDTVGIGMRDVGDAVGVHGRHQPQVDSIWYSDGHQIVDDTHSGDFVPVDRSDNENHGATRCTATVGLNWATLHRGADDPVRND